MTFLAENIEVILIDIFIICDRKNIAHLIGENRFKFSNHDVTNYIYTKDKLDFVLRLASPVSPNYYLNYPKQTFKISHLRAISYIDLALAISTTLLLASTSEIIEEPVVNPQREDNLGK